MVWSVSGLPQGHNGITDVRDAWQGEQAAHDRHAPQEVYRLDQGTLSLVNLIFEMKKNLP